MGITIIQGSTGDAEFPGPIRFESPSTELVFTPGLSSAITGPGRLVLGEGHLSWQHPSVTVRIDYRDILIHALSRGDSDRVTQKPCLYLQLDETAAKAAQQSVISSVETPTDPNGAGGNVAQDEEETVFEMRIVPAAGDAVLEDMFLALCECAALHPDPRDADDSDQENDNAEWTVGTADYESNAPLGRQSEMAPIQLTEEGRIQAERLEAMLFSSSKTTTEEEEAPISKGDQERPLDR